MTKTKAPLASEGEEDEQDLDIPVLLPSTTNRFPNPNLPLKLDVDGILTLSANDFVSKRTIILGESGAGKGNTGALLEEHLLDHGLPMTIVDLEGESWSLKEMCPTLLVVGRSTHADREYAPEQMGRLAELSVEQGFSVVLDFSGYEEEEYYALLGPYLKGLWAACDRKRTPYHLALDEAHEFVPQVGTTPVKQRVIRIAKRGRKRGLGMIAMSQETASVDNQLLKQSGITILLSVHYPADLDRYHTLIPGMSRAAIEQMVPKFPQGKGLVISKHVPYEVQMLQRRTFDPSQTPQLGTDVQEPTLYNVDETTLQVLDEQLPSSVPLTPERMDRATLIELVKMAQRQDAGVDGTSSHATFVALQASLEQKEQELASLREQETQLREEHAQLLAAMDEKDAIIQRLEARGDQEPLAEGTPLPMREQSEGTIPLEMFPSLGEQTTRDSARLVRTDMLDGDAGEGTSHRITLEPLMTHLHQLEADKGRLENEVMQLRARLDGKESRGEAITNVHFDQANIDTFNAGTGVAVRGGAVERQEQVQPSVAVTEIVPSPEMALTGEALLQALRFSERKSFGRLSAQVERLSPTEKVLLIWLLEHDGEEFSSLQLTDAVNVDIQAAWSNRTEKLAKLPFIRRWMNKKLWYQADFATYSSKSFSSVAPEVLAQELVRIASPF